MTFLTTDLETTFLNADQCMTHFKTTIKTDCIVPVKQCKNLLSKSKSISTPRTTPVN